MHPVASVVGGLTSRRGSSIDGARDSATSRRLPSTESRRRTTSRAGPGGGPGGGAGDIGGGRDRVLSADYNSAAPHLRGMVRLAEDVVQHFVPHVRWDRFCWFLVLGVLLPLKLALYIVVRVLDRGWCRTHDMRDRPLVGGRYCLGCCGKKLKRAERPRDDAGRELPSNFASRFADSLNACAARITGGKAPRLRPGKEGWRLVALQQKHGASGEKMYVRAAEALLDMVKRQDWVRLIFFTLMVASVESWLYLQCNDQTNLQPAAKGVRCGVSLSGVMWPLLAFLLHTVVRAHMHALTDEYEEVHRGKTGYNNEDMVVDRFDPLVHEEAERLEFLVRHAKYAQQDPRKAEKILKQESNKLPPTLPKANWEQFTKWKKRLFGQYWTLMRDERNLRVLRYLALMVSKPVAESQFFHTYHHVHLRVSAVEPGTPERTVPTYRIAATDLAQQLWMSTVKFKQRTASTKDDREAEVLEQSAAQDETIEALNLKDRAVQKFKDKAMRTQTTWRQLVIALLLAFVQSSIPIMYRLVAYHGACVNPKAQLNWNYNCCFKPIADPQKSNYSYTVFDVGINDVFENEFAGSSTKRNERAMDVYECQQSCRPIMVPTKELQFSDEGSEGAGAGGGAPTASAFITPRPNATRAYQRGGTPIETALANRSFDEACKYGRLPNGTVWWMAGEGDVGEAISPLRLLFSIDMWPMCWQPLNWLLGESCRAAHTVDYVPGHKRYQAHLWYPLPPFMITIASFVASMYFSLKIIQLFQRGHNVYIRRVDLMETLSKLLRGHALWMEISATKNPPVHEVSTDRRARAPTSLSVTGTAAPGHGPPTSPPRGGAGTPAAGARAAAGAKEDRPPMVFNGHSLMPEAASPRATGGASAAGDSDSDASLSDEDDEHDDKHMKQVRFDAFSWRHNLVAWNATRNIVLNASRLEMGNQGAIPLGWITSFLLPVGLYGVTTLVRGSNAPISVSLFFAIADTVLAGCYIVIILNDALKANRLQEEQLDHLKVMRMQLETRLMERAHRYRDVEFDDGSVPGVLEPSQMAAVVPRELGTAAALKALSESPPAADDGAETPRRGSTGSGHESGRDARARRARSLSTARSTGRGDARVTINPARALAGATSPVASGGGDHGFEMTAREGKGADGTADSAEDVSTGLRQRTGRARAGTPSSIGSDERRFSNASAIAPRFYKRSKLKNEATFLMLARASQSNPVAQTVLHDQRFELTVVGPLRRQLNDLIDVVASDTTYATLFGAKVTSQLVISVFSLLGATLAAHLGRIVDAGAALPIAWCAPVTPLPWKVPDNAQQLGLALDAVLKATISELEKIPLAKRFFEAYVSNVTGVANQQLLERLLPSPNQPIPCTSLRPWALGTPSDWVRALAGVGTGSVYKQ